MQFADYENTLLPRAVKQAKLVVRWNHISFINRFIFQTVGLEVSDRGHSSAILYPAFWFGASYFQFWVVFSKYYFGFSTLHRLKFSFF